MKLEATPQAGGDGKQDANLVQIHAEKTSSLVAFRAQVREAYKKKFEKASYRKAIKDRLTRLLVSQRDMEYNHRREQMEDERFYEGLITSDDRVAREHPSLRDLRLNIVRKSVNFLSGLAKSRAVTGHVVASGVGAYGPANVDQQMMQAIIEEYSRRLKIVQENTRWKYLRNERIDNACRCGIGYLHHYPMPSYETGKIVIKTERPHWRNVWYDTNCQDYANAEFCFVMSQRDAERAKARYPKYKRWIDDNAEDYMQSMPVDNMNDQSYLIYNLHGWTAPDGSTPGETRRQIVIGSAYYRDTVMMGAYPIDVMFCVKVATRRDFSDMEIIGEPVFMGFTRPPVVPLFQSRFSETGFPYTALVRDRRGIARTMNAMLRNWMHLITSRGVIVNVSGLPPEINQDQYMRAITRRVQNAVFAIPEHGEKQSTRIENLQADVQKLAGGIGMLFNLAKDTSEVHAALMGEKMPDSGSLMQIMKNDATIAVSEFHDRCDRAAQEDSEIVLSYIEQFNSYIDFGWSNANGQLVTATADGDYTIEGNKAWFHINESNRDEMLMETHQKILTALISKLDGQLALPLYSLFIKSTQMPDAEKMVQDLNALSAKYGIPALPSTMTEEQKQAEAQEQQKQKQLQDALAQAELRKAQAEAYKDEAQGYKNQKTADQPQNEKEAELRATIARQTRELVDKGGNAGTLFNQRRNQ